MKTKKSSKKILILALSTLAFPVVIFMFVLAPIYGVVGDNTKTDAQKQAVIDRAARTSTFFQIIVGIITVIVVIWFAKQMYTYAKNRKK